MQHLNAGDVGSSPAANTVLSLYKETTIRYDCLSPESVSNKKQVDSAELLCYDVSMKHDDNEQFPPIEGNPNGVGFALIAVLAVLTVVILLI